MKLLQRLKIWRELKRLETRVRESPSPTTFVDLGQVYINLGLQDQALRVSEEGLALFPNSKELRKLNSFVKRGLVRGEVKELRDRLNKSPQPELYQELARLYLELGDFGAVYGTCEESIRRFPDDVESHFLMGRACLTGFYRDFHAGRGLEAASCLETVIQRDPSHVRGLKAYAELMYRVGATDRALEAASQLRELCPTDLEVEVLLRQLQQTPEGEHCDLEELFCAAESRGGLARGPIVAEAPTMAPKAAKPSAGGAARSTMSSSIRDALEQIAQTPGVTKAAYIRGSKALIKGEIRSGKDPFLRFARVVSKAAQRTCRRMDLGNFSKGVVDGDFGHVCVCTFGEVVAAVLCEPETPVDSVLGDLQELVAKSLYVAGTGAK